MGYNNYPNRSNYGNQRQSYGNQRQYNGGGQPRQQYKKSWAVYGTIKQGKYAGAPFVIGFKKSRQGLIKASVMPYKGTAIVKSKNGHEYIKMIAEVTVDGLNPTLVPCLYSKTTKKVVLDSMSMVISPNGSGTLRSGRRVTGFFGNNYK